MRERLKSLIISRAIEKKGGEGFLLSSGRRSALYIDLRKITQDPEGISLVGELVLSKIREICPDARFIGGLETASIPISTAVVLLSYQKSGREFDEVKLGAFWVRKKQKDHGLENKIEGVLEKEGRAVIVDDTLTTGSSSLQAAEAVRNFGAKVVLAIGVVDRGAGENFKNAKIPYTFLFSENELT